MRGGGRWVVIGLILILHFAFHPWWGRWTAGPDLLVGGLLLAALHVRAGQAAILGFVLGALEASMALGPLGPTMLVLVLSGFGGAWIRDVFYSDSGRFGPTFLIIGVWIVEIALGLVSGAPVSASSLVVAAPASAVLTMVICVGLDRFVRVFFG